MDRDEAVRMDLITILIPSWIAYLVLDKALMNVVPWRQAMPVEPIFEDDLVLAFSTEPGTSQHLP